MNKRTLTILGIGILALGLAACQLPFAPDPPTPFFSPTPNLTMTALFSPDNIATATPGGQVVATATSPPLVTATPLPLPTNTDPPPLPTNTSLPPTATTIPERGATFNAAYLSSPPDLDGVWDEWTNKAYPASYIVFGANKWENAADQEGSFRVAWDNDYLYIAVKVFDDVYAQNASGGEIFRGDSIEVLLDTNLFGDFADMSLSSDDYQLGISPGQGDIDDDPEAYLWYPRSVAGSRDQVKIAAVDGNGLYRVEAAIPWSVFGVTPSDGLQLGFALSVSDNDNTSDNEQQSMTSSVPNRVLTNPTTWGELVLKR